MQTTLTVSGKRYTGGQIAKRMTQRSEIHPDDYMVKLGDRHFFANYRNRHSPYWADVCKPEEANAIALTPCNGRFYGWFIWIKL